MQSTRLAKLLDFLNTDPNDPFILYALATEYVSQGEDDTALDYYNRLLSDHPDYVGTYYHLGKLHERHDRKQLAIEIYQSGMAIARSKRDMHAFSELQGAYNSASGLDYEDD
ncbi:MULTISPECIES: tetratricopeptide repeat protein [Pedobacter]|uniref:tetratricopeptide repeat protein n=1 Tax=Pedobacter TaxID=84567 RepID=UPI00210868FC|nr:MULTISPECIES: tetratricopeptide repeat protein [unclassified Pedobacter]